MSEITTQAPLACDLNAVAVDEREQHLMNARQIFGMAAKVRELSDGYSLQLPNDSSVLLGVVKFIDHERECCPFFHFAIEVEPERGPLWLTLRGQEGVKEVVRSWLLVQVPSPVAQPA